MDLREPFPCSEENGTGGFPAANFQGSWIPETPLRPVPARRQMDEGDDRFPWLRSLGISATLHNQTLFVQNAGSAEPSSSVSTATSHWDGVQPFSLPEEDGASCQRQVYGNAAPVENGRGSHGGSDACSFINSGSIGGDVLQSSFPAQYHPQNSNGWHQNDILHPFLNAPNSLSRYGLETNGWSNVGTSQTNHYGFPVPYTAAAYSIQSPPFKEAANSRTSEAFAAPVAPVTPGKIVEKGKVVDTSKAVPADISKCSSLFTDERVHERQKGGLTPASKICNDNQNDLAVNESLKSLVDSQESVTHSPVREIIDCVKVDADDINLNKTPRQKPKRKKIRPKVVREGKPRRTPKKVEVKQTPEGTPVERKRRTSTGGRTRKPRTANSTYARESDRLQTDATRIASCKRSLNFDLAAPTFNGPACLQPEAGKFGPLHQHPVERKRRTSTGGRTRKPRTANSTYARESDRLQIDATRIASCKRSLNFDLAAPTFNGPACLQPEAGKFGPLHQHPVEEEKVTVENFRKPATFDLNHSLIHLPESQPTQLENPCAHAPKRKASSMGCVDNMAQKKNNTVNAGIEENYQDILSTMMHDHISANMMGYNLFHVYNTLQKKERMTSTTSQNSSSSANVETNLHGAPADIGPEAREKSTTGLIQTPLKHPGSPMELFQQHMKQTHAIFNSYRGPQFQDRSRNQKTETRPQELQPHWSSTSIVQETCASKAEEYRVLSTNNLTVENCEQALVLQGSNKEEKQKATEPNKCIHDENSYPESVKQHNDAKQYHHVQNMLECNNVHGRVEEKRKPNHIPPHDTLFFSSATRKGCTLEHNPEDLLPKSPAKKPRNKRTRKRSSPAMMSAPSATMGGHETCNYQGQGSQAASNHISKRGNLVAFVHDCHSSSNLQDKLLISSLPQSIPSTNPLDQTTERLNRLDICRKDASRSATVEDGRVQNAIVPYIDGTMVPYAGSFEPVRPRRQRPKVDLDEETARVWNLLMGSEISEGINGTDADKAKWWEEERKVFRGRVDSFIARMHLIQGDRRFSQWKGSVVDSVVGVFLTQNVSDHLSSSAFMSMAAHFPKKETANCTTLDRKDITLPACGKDHLPIDLHDANTCMDKPVSIGNLEPDSTSFTIQNSNCKVSTFVDTNNKTEPCGGTAPYKKGDDTNTINPTTGKVLHDSYANANSCQSVPGSRSRAIEHEDANFPTFPVISSHNSADSTTIQATYQICSSPESIAFAIRKCEQVSFHQPSFSELLSMTESPLFKDLYSTGGFNLLREENFGKTCDQAQQENWRTGFGKGERSSSSVGIGNSPVVHKFTNSLLPESTSCITTLGTRMLPQGNRTYFPVERYCTLEPTKPKELCELSCTAELLSLNFSSKAKETTGLHSLEHEVPMNSQTSMGAQVEVSSQGKTIRNGNKSTTKPLKSKKGKGDALSRKETWEPLRQQVLKELGTQERNPNRNDSLDWEAVRRADVNEIAQTIKERGMNNMLAERIRGFLDRLVEDHGSIDLEWLRNVPPDKSKDFLLSIKGLGLKSVECVRLLTLHHLAFPVDTNVGRISVRLGWVPLQPLPESLQLHLLELYPILETIQKYLWPRLCKLDQRTLYELHYQLITFGKVFCTKSRPNCNACPMRGECKHFASAFASARLALPAPEERSMVSAAIPVMAELERDKVFFHPLPPPVELFPSIELPPTQKYNSKNTCEPIIEEPETPEPEFVKSSESAIEDFDFDDPDDIPTIKLNLDELTSNLKTYMQGKNMELQEADMSKALVVLTPEAASIPTPKLKNVSRLRTEHQVYELPDDHPLIEGLDKREPDDPCFYLLAIWTPGETSESIDLPSACCEFQSSGGLCDKETCFSCNAIREANSQTVRGTLLIPCRTAMRGSFPLNGTYFQVNEVFADHESSLNPIAVPRKLIWNLPRRTVHFGTSVTTIFRGFVCVRGFDQKTRAPRPLMARLHFPASKQTRNKMATAKGSNE